MPKGFSGRAALRYLTDTTQAHNQATSAASSPPVSSPPSPSPRHLPFTPEDARVSKGGRHITGQGNSNNIVVDQDEYEAICNKINQADDKIGESYYRIALEIEQLCQTSFILPSVVPRCLNICNNIKDSLGEFRSLTEDATLEMRKFARDITDIGH